MNTLTVNEAAVIVGAAPGTIRSDIKRDVIRPARVPDAEGKPRFFWEHLPILASLYTSLDEEPGLIAEQRRLAFRSYDLLCRSGAELIAVEMKTYLEASHSPWAAAKNRIADLLKLARHDSLGTGKEPPHLVITLQEEFDTLNLSVERLLDQLSLQITKNLILVIGPAVAAIDRTADIYSRGLCRIESTTERQSGEYVFIGTRTSVRQIGAQYSKGDSIEQILEDYPHLKRDDVEFAKLFWEAHPPTGRPSKKPAAVAHDARP